MGRVTVFTITGCPFCIKAKTALKERNIPYVEINLTEHPEKRSDMLSLSNSLTVPQIFFNEKHIGGATETIEFLEKEEYTESRYKKEIKDQPEPTDERLSLPTSKPVNVDSSAPPRGEDDNITIPNSDKQVMSILDITKRLVQSTPSKNLPYYGTTYKNSIKGSDFINHLMKEFSIKDKKDAISFASTLQKRGIVHHVTSEHEIQDTDNLFYRLQPFQTPNVLNSYIKWDIRVDEDYMAIISRLAKLMQSIETRATDKDGNVDLIEVVKDEKYAEFEENVCELQGIDMNSMDDNTKTAFIINVYNLMIKYSRTKYQPRKDSSAQRAGYFTKVLTNIGNELFSFQDLENGILRANALPPYALKAVFQAGDERVRHIVKKVDPRLHFALNCGAKSCPPVKKFSARDIQEELRIVALAFCEQEDNVQIDVEANELHLNMIFKWYRPDFASNISGLPKALLPYLLNDRKESLQTMIDKNVKIKIKFNTYDWSSNISRFVEFNPSLLKANEVSLKNIFTRS